MPTTPLQAFPYPSLTDPANGPLGIQNLAVALEAKTVYDTLSTTMPAHRKGRLVYQTDLNLLVVSTGTVWRQVGLAPVRGTAQIIAGVPNGATDSVVVVFPAGRFTVAPIVTAIALNSRLTVALAAVSATQVTLAVGNWSGGSSPAGVVLHYVATDA